MQILFVAEVYFIHRQTKEKQSLEVEDGEAVRWSTGLAPGWHREGRERAGRGRGAGHKMALREKKTAVESKGGKKYRVFKSDTRCYLG